jgi:hypothetical protein
MLMTQLTSWDPYEGWDTANEILVMPEDLYSHPKMTPVIGRHPGRNHTTNFVLHERKDEDGNIEIIHPPQLYDDDMKKLEAANPETFRR